MKIALINGSPKYKESASQSILNDLKKYFNDHEILEYTFNKTSIDKNICKEIASVDAIILAFPLYVDSIPSHLLRCLYDMEEYFNNNSSNINVYAIVNSGFYEGIQNQHALDIIKNWCDHCNFKYGQGIGLGAGGMLLSIKNVPVGKGPKKSLATAYEMLFNNIVNKSTDENIFVSPSFPRFLYKAAAQMGWRQMAKANGLKRKDLFNQIKKH